MTDDLVKWLREASRQYVDNQYNLQARAANRIEKLEAALRKYAEEEYNGFNGNGEHARKALEGKE